jgi:hypothetical protein
VIRHIKINRKRKQMRRNKRDLGKWNLKKKIIG